MNNSLLTSTLTLRDENKTVKSRIMLQGSYLTVTKSCKYCGGLETHLLLVTTGFVMGGGSWLGDTVTGSVCLGRSTGLFWTG